MESLFPGKYWSTCYPAFQFTGISLIGCSLLKIIAHNTGSPVPEMNGRTVKWMSVVAPAGAAALPTFFGIIKSSPPTFPSFS